MAEPVKQPMNRQTHNGRTPDTLASVANETVRGATEFLRDQFDDVRLKMKDYGKKAKFYTDEVTDSIEKHPFYAVLGATAVGFILGKLLSRK